MDQFYKRECACVSQILGSQLANRINELSQVQEESSARLVAWQEKSTSDAMRVAQLRGENQEVRISKVYDYM